MMDRPHSSKTVKRESQKLPDQVWRKKQENHHGLSVPQVAVDVSIEFAEAIASIFTKNLGAYQVYGEWHEKDAQKSEEHQRRQLLAQYTDQ